MTTTEQLKAERERYAGILANVETLEAHMRNMYAKHLVQRQFSALPRRWRESAMRGNARLNVNVDQIPPITEEARASARTQIEQHIAALDAKIASV